MIDPEYISSFASGALTGTAVILGFLVFLWAIDVSRLRSYTAVARPQAESE
jgi:hypothetical protein